MKRSTLLAPVAGFLCLLALSACDPQEGDTTPDANQPPQTHLAMGYFRTDSAQVDTLALSNAVVEMAWWAEDADGTIDHYEYRWNYDLDSLGQELWYETTAESDSFIVMLTTQQDTFRFEVRAYDDLGATDPTPAAVSLPIYNTMPSVAWVANSQEILSSEFDADTSWTFPYVSFHFNVWDLDGRETITRILWAMDDTTQWNEAEPGLGQLSFGPEDLAPGPHRIFLKAQDIAEAWSQTLSYPRASDTLATGEPVIWMVRDTFGDLLVIHDDADYASLSAQEIGDALNALGMVEYQDYTFWPGYRWLPFDEEDFLAILNQFDKVIWSAWRNANLEDGCEVLERYLANSGKLLVGTTDVGRAYEDDNGEHQGYVYDELCLPITILPDSSNNRVFLFPDHAMQPIGARFAHYPVLHPTQRVTCRGSGDEELWFGIFANSTGVVGADTVAVYPLYMSEEAPPRQGFDNPEVILGTWQTAVGYEDKASLIFLEFPLFRLEELDQLISTVINNDFNW